MIVFVNLCSFLHLLGEVSLEKPVYRSNGSHVEVAEHELQRIRVGDLLEARSEVLKRTVLVNESMASEKCSDETEDASTNLRSVV